MDQKLIKIMVQKLTDQEYMKNPNVLNVYKKAQTAMKRNQKDQTSENKFLGKEFLHLIQKWGDLKAEKEELELQFELQKIETQKIQKAAAVIEDISQKVIDSLLK